MANPKYAPGYPCATGAAVCPERVEVRNRLCPACGKAVADFRRVIASVRRSARSHRSAKVRLPSKPRKTLPE